MQHDTPPVKVASTDGLGAAPKRERLKRGQLCRLEQYGLVRFDRLDFYHGEVTAKLTGIDYPGTYYPFAAELEKQGFTIVDA